MNKWIGFEWEAGKQHYEVLGKGKRSSNAYVVLHKECDYVWEVYLDSIKNRKKLRCPNCQKIKPLVQEDTFGRLTVLGPFKYMKTRSGKNLLYYLCRCACKAQTEKWVSQHSLVFENTKSCGCLVTEADQKKRLDLVGEKFGRLLVLCFENDCNKGASKFFCYCDPELGGCGKTVSVLGSNLVRGKTKSCGCLKSELASLRNSGKNHWCWRGGVTSVNHQIRECMQMVWWRRFVFERDNYAYVVSGQIGGELEVHHIKPFRVILEENNITTLEEALACEELWNVSNGVTLAKSWHRHGVSNPNSFHNQYPPNSKFTELDFEEWRNKWRK